MSRHNRTTSVHKKMNVITGHPEHEALQGRPVSPEVAVMRTGGESKNLSQRVSFQHELQV